MKVSSLTIKNVLGIKEFSLDPGAITVISGRNASGKTSVLTAFRNLIGGGSLAELRNTDSDEKAEICLVFDDAPGQIRVKKTEKKLSVKKQVGDSAAFEDVPAPQRFLDSLFDAKMSNPVEFIRCRDKDRVQLLLEAIDLEFDRDALWGAMELSPDDFPKIPAGLHPLVEISMIKDNVFRERTGVNRDEKQKRATTEQTRRAIPAEIPTVEDLEGEEHKLSVLRGQHEQLIREAGEDFERTEAQLVDEVVQLEVATSSDYELLSERLKREMIERLTAARDKDDKTIQEARKTAQAKIVEASDIQKRVISIANELLPEIETRVEEIAALKERQKEIIKIQVLHDQANEFEDQADRLKGDGKRLSKALDTLDDYKAAMCSNLPIPGLDVSGNVVMLDGIPWNQVNTGKQIETAVKVSCLRFKDAQFRPVLVDGAEALDSEAMEKLKTELKGAGAQAFIGRVSDCDLEVEK